MRDIWKQQFEEMLDGLCQWFIDRQDTCPNSPHGWFGQYAPDTIARAVDMAKMVPLRHLYAITAVLKVGKQRENKDWLKAGHRAVASTVEHYGPVNILDHHAGYMLVSLAEQGLISWDNPTEKLIREIVTLLVSAISSEDTFPHHIGIDPSPAHGNGSKNHPVGTAIGVTRFLFLWEKFRKERGLKSIFNAVEVAERALKKAKMTQKETGGIPYNFSLDSVPQLSYHLVSTEMLAEIYAYCPKYRGEITQTSRRAFDYLCPPRIKKDGSFNIATYDKSLSSYFTTTYSMGIKVLAMAKQFFPNHGYAKFISKLLQKLYTCYSPKYHSVRERVELVPTPYHKNILKLTDFSKPRWNSYPINAQVVYSLSGAKDFL